MEGHGVNFSKTDGGDVSFTVVTDKESFVKERATFTFNGSKTLAATYWRPKGEVKCGMFLCHGYGEYLCISYDELAEYLSSRGVLVFGHDHVGHGRSSGQRVQVESMDDYVDPVIGHVEAVKQWPALSNKSVFLLGHSMGGLISLFTVFRKESLFKGVILMGPLLEIDPNLATPFKKLLAKIMQGIFPSFSIGGLQAEHITRDQDHVKKIQEDQLIWHGGFRARHSYVLMQSCDYAVNNLTNITLPMLVLQGTDDKLVTPKGAQTIFDSVSSTDKEVKFYDDAYHHLYAELPDVKADSIKLTFDFMMKRL